MPPGAASGTQLVSLALTSAHPRASGARIDIMMDRVSRPACKDQCR